MEDPQRESASDTSQFIRERFLLDIARHLATSLDLNEVLQRIGEAARHIVKAYGCTIYLLDDSGEVLNPVISLDPDYGAQLMSAPLQINSSLTGQAVMRRQGVIFNDAASHAVAQHIPGTPRNEQEHVIVVPFLVDDQVLGAICLNRQEIEFCEGDLRLVEVFAAYASVALKNARTADELRLETARREQSVQALRVSEARYRQLIEAADDIIYTCDLEGHITSANLAAIQLLGYGLDEILTLSLFDLIDPVYWDTVWTDLELKERGEDTMPTEALVYTKDGGVVWLEARTRLLQDKHGKPSILGIARDVTEAKRVRETLRENEALLIATLESTADAILVVDENGAIAHFNSEFARLWNLSPAVLKERLDQKLIEAILHDVIDSEGFVERTRQIYDSADESFDTIRFVDGRIIERYSRSLIRDGRSAGRVWSFRDVTQRVCTENALRERELRISSILRAAPVGIAVLENRVIREANDRLCQITGYSREELIGKEAHFLYPSYAEWEYVGSAQRAKVAARDASGVETRWCRKDGDVINILLTFTPMDPDDPSQGVTSAVMDITDMKRTQEMLRMERDYTTEIIRSTPVIICGIAEDGSTTFINPAGERITGYSADELIGRNWWRTFYPGSEYDQVERLLSRMRLADVKDYEMTLITKDGQCRTILWNSATSRDSEGKVLEIIGFGNDITERYQAEQELRESEERVRVLINAPTESAVLTDVEGIVRAGNAVASESVGMTVDELIGESVYTLLPAELVEMRRSYMESVARTGKPVEFEDEWGGVIRQNRIYPVRDATGQVTLLAGFTRDVTVDRKREREQLKIEKLESVGTLAGGIAHDFNNILTGIMGNLALAQLQVEQGSDLADLLQEAESASLRARDLTQQLLTFSKGGAPIRKMASISDLLTDTATFALRGSNVAIQFDIAPDLWPAEVDKGQLSQVIHNLVLNADQAMPEGGAIRVCAENAHVGAEDVLPLPAGPFVCVRVVDQGTGMPAGILSKIFDPYFSTKQHGSGLGLTTVHSIVKAHGGHITVESEMGMGSTFVIYLPAAPAAAEPAASETSMAFSDAKTAKVLVMDDEPLVQRIARDMLQREGHDVHLAADGAQAIEMYATAREAGAPFELVIVDLTVPGGMGGRETLERLLQIDPDVKVIVSSGYSMDAVMAEPGAYGFCGVVAKPYRPEELHAAVYSVLNCADE